MSEKATFGVEQVRCALLNKGFGGQVVEFSRSTRSAEEAALAVGCELGQIVKSLVFEGLRSHRPFLVLVSGKNRVQEKKLEELVGEPIKKAAADFVKQKTGFSIGGVPPVGHRGKLETFIDQDLLSYREIWAAAGSPSSVFKLSPADLLRLTGGRVISVT